LIKRISKKDIPLFLDSPVFWNLPFLSITRHRLFAHSRNPMCDDDDIVLLLAYDNDNIVGYMGAYVDRIIINNISQKISWLSTWWVHPNTKGKGIGRRLLETMYTVHNGKIGVSQFTPSAKRIYEKSHYFNFFKKIEGYKFIYRSNLSVVLPLVNSRFSAFRIPLKFIDKIFNLFFNLKLKIYFFIIKKKTNSVNLEYVNNIDKELYEYINTKNSNHLCKKDKAYFEWLKGYHWVQESPLINFVKTNKYEFSMGVQNFNLYLIKILSKNEIQGFIVLQRKDSLLKVLFSYYCDSKVAAQIVCLHVIELQIKQLLCYDKNINSELLKMGVFLYKRKKLKEVIISKAFGDNNYDDFIFNLGDGDCSFA